MKKTIDLPTIAGRIRVSDRLVRYIVDHEIAGRVRALGRRVPRECNLIDAFGIGLAARLLNGGVKRDAVKTMMHTLTRPFPVELSDGTGSYLSGTGSNLRPICETEALVHWEIGDGVNVRYGTRISKDPPKVEYSSWIQIKTRAGLEPGYDPRVLIRISLELLRLDLGISGQGKRAAPA